ncbi:MAG: 4'-phosphopantetheinyl transferase superfamily protein, partial [Gammaproteobacteria bacterium]
MHFRTLAGNHEITVPAACGWSRLATCIPAARDSRGQIAVLAASVLPSDAVAIGGAIPEWQAPLFSTELAHVRRAVPARRAEFTAGRTCARRALETLGAPAQAIGTGPRREPRWPAGVVGSISHAAGRCVAAVAPADHLAGLGIDLESADPLSEELARMVCGPQEMGWCARQPVRLQGRLRKLIFSAKESVFKCLYPVFRREIDFADARIAVNLSS